MSKTFMGEIVLLKEKITDLQLAGYIRGIYVVSPFRSIAAFYSNELRSISQVSCITIQKFQSKEPDVVFLILDIDSQSFGARNRISEKLNMLKLVIIRSMKRLYVIGNKTLQDLYDLIEFE